MSNLRLISDSARINFTEFCPEITSVLRRFSRQFTRNHEFAQKFTKFDSEYLKSVGPHTFENMIKFESGFKHNTYSKGFFYTSADRKCFIKTISESQLKVLTEPGYLKKLTSRMVLPVLNCSPDSNLSLLPR